MACGRKNDKEMVRVGGGWLGLGRRRCDKQKVGLGKKVNTGKKAMSGREAMSDS